MKQCILTIGFLFWGFMVISQTTTKGFQWINHHGDGITKNPEKVEDIQTDQWGNIYVAGQVNDLFVRDSTGAIIRTQNNMFLDSLYNHGGLDTWLAKYDPQGNLLWHRYIGGGGDDKYYDMVTDKNGNCYIAGSLSNHNLRPPSTVGRLVLASNQLGTYVAKVDLNGSLLWHKSFGGDTVRNVFIEYPASITNLQLNSQGNLSAFILGGGQSTRAFHLLFDVDSLISSYHELKFDLNGNYLGFNTYPFPVFNRLPQITSINSNSNGTLISGILNQDTTLIGNDTLVKSGLDNAFVAAFDSNYNHISTFYGTNSYEQFMDAKLYGDTLVTAGHYNLFANSTVTFDTLSHTGTAGAYQESGIFLFHIDGSLLGLYPSTSVSRHTATVASAYIDQNTVGIGGSFNRRMTYSGGSSYIEAVDKCANCTNIDLFFALLDRRGNLIAEDVIYTSGFQNDAVFAMHRRDSMLYIGGFVGDSVIIEGVDTFIARGDHDAFIAAYNVGLVTSINEPSNYIKADNGILAYPNPTQGQVTLMGKAVNNEAQLYTISGQVVKSYRLNKNAFQQPVNLEGLDSGIYFLVIVGEGVRQQVRIVKQ